MLVFSIHWHRVSLGFFPPNMGHEDSSHGHGDFKPAKHDMERGWMGYHWGCDPAASGGRRTAQRVWGPREVAATNRVWNKRRRGRGLTRDVNHWFELTFLFGSFPERVGEKEKIEWDFMALKQRFLQMLKTTAEYLSRTTGEKRKTSSNEIF